MMFPSALALALADAVAELRRVGSHEVCERLRRAIDQSADCEEQPEPSTAGDDTGLTKKQIRDREYAAKRRLEKRLSTTNRPESSTTNRPESSQKSSKSSVVVDGVAPASEPLSVPLSAENSSSPPEKNSEKRERNARESRPESSLSRLDSRSEVVSESSAVVGDNGYDKTPPTPLWIKLYKIWEEVVHNSMPSGSPSTYQRDLEPLATGLLARRPKDPEGLFREVLIKYVAAKRKADKKPALNFFCRDFAGEADYRERERDNAPPPSSWVNPEADAQMRRDLNGGSQAYEAPPALDALIAKVGKRVPA